MTEGNKKMRVNKAMTTTMNISVCEDIILEILSRLPVKSLQRFRCVCKSWCAHITDPAFVKMHLSRSLASNNSSNHSLILTGSSFYSVDLDACEKQAVVELDHPLNSPTHGTQVLGSCNGLLCISKIPGIWDLSKQDYYEELFLWNPCTRRHKKLPIAPMDFPPDFTYQSVILTHHFVYGFGYDPATDDYKLVRVEQARILDETWDSKAMVYSLRTNSWRSLGYMPYKISPYQCGLKYGVFLNSAIHWTAMPRNWESRDPILLIAFDLKNEVCRELSVPCRELSVPRVVNKMFCMNIGVVGGELCLLCSVNMDVIEVWVMKDYGVRESWVKLFALGQRTILLPTPISYLKSGEVIFGMGGADTYERKQQLFLYDPHKRPRIRNLRIRGIPSMMRAEVYIQSLVSLDSKDGIEQERKEEKETEVII